MTDTITYRDLAPSDTDAVMDIVSHWSVTRQLGRWPFPPERAFVERRCQGYKGANGSLRAICKNDHLIGTIGLINARLGYMLHPSQNGQGIMSGAVRFAIMDAWDRYPNWTEIRASTWADNPVSQAVLRKHGFVHWQTLYEQLTPRRLPKLGYDWRLLRG